jgi:DNA-binding transcriptional ArsR family regulator
LDRLFAALGDPTRLALVERLLDEGEATAGALAAPFAISKPAISRHLAVLESAGLIERRVSSRWRVARARPEAMAALGNWVERHRDFWEASFDRLAEIVERPAEMSAGKTEEKKS